MDFTFQPSLSRLSSGFLADEKCQAGICGVMTFAPGLVVLRHGPTGLSKPARLGKVPSIADPYLQLLAL